MAQELNPLAGQVLTPVSAVNPGNSFERLGNAAGALSNVITDKLSRVAAEQAAIQGMSDAAEGKAPKTLMPGLTKATAAYNKAVSQTEGLRISRTAREQINEAYIRHSNPKTFNEASPAIYHAEVEGIVQGAVENARPENKSYIINNAAEYASGLSLKMLEHSIKYDNNNFKQELSRDVKSYNLDANNAAWEGNTKGVRDNYSYALKSLNDAAIINQEVAAQLPELKEAINKDYATNEIILKYAQAKSNDEQLGFMSALAKDNTIPFDIKAQASKQITTAYTVEKKLQYAQQATTYQENHEQIKTNLDYDADTINTLPVTDIQKSQLRELYTATQVKHYTNQARIAKAYSDIKAGRASIIPSQVKSIMFNNNVKEADRILKQGDPERTLSTSQMSMMLTGEAMPLSGAINVPFGTNVSEFDSLLTSQIESGDGPQVMEAALTYNRVVNNLKQPNLINLSGKSLAVVNSFAVDLNAGSTPEQAADLAIAKVLHATEPQIVARKEYFKNHFARIDQSTGRSNLDTIFKETFGVSNEPLKTDAAFGTFSQLFNDFYLYSGDKQSSIASVKHIMRGWGTSKWFAKGTMSSSVPETDPLVPKVAYTFSNQVNIGLQRVIDNNRELRGSNIPTSAIEWENKSNSIDWAALNENDLVFKQLGASGLPRIKVDGVASDVVLIAGPDVRTGDTLTYTYGYYDQNNILQVLPDMSNQQTHVGQFRVSPIDKWSPTAFKGQKTEKANQAFNDIKSEENKVFVKAMFSAWDFAKLLGQGADETRSIYDRAAKTAEERILNSSD